MFQSGYESDAVYIKSGTGCTVQWHLVSNMVSNKAIKLELN